MNPETNVYGIDHECWNQELPAIAVVLGRSRTLLLDWDYRKKREDGEAGLKAYQTFNKLQDEKHQLVTEEGWDGREDRGGNRGSGEAVPCDEGQGRG